MTLHRPTVAEQVADVDARLEAVDLAEHELAPNERSLRAICAQRRDELEHERRRLTERQQP